MNETAYADPYLDVDEHRDEPVPHRYIHGGFTGTQAKFSFYFPPEARFRRRLLLHSKTINAETTAATPAGAFFGAGSLSFAVESGAVLVETNNGMMGPIPPGDGWLVNVTAARYAKQLAADYYRTPVQYGYVFGGSGGGYQTTMCHERAGDLIQGSVPFIWGPHPMRPEAGLAALANAERLLAPKLDEILDATDPGGDGNPFVESLTVDEREALADLYAVGLQPGAEIVLRASLLGTLASQGGTFAPAQYLEDFWTQPGYEGAAGRLDGQVIDVHTTIKETFTAAALGDLLQHHATAALPGLFASDTPVAVSLEDPDVAALGGDRLRGITLRIVSGPLKGRVIPVTGVVGDVLLALNAIASEGLDGVAPGDEVVVSNRDFLAFCHLHRHQADARYPEYARYTMHGKPVFPQADRQAPLEYTGRYDGKCIQVQTVQDEAALASHIVHYRGLVQANNPAGLDNYRVYWVDHAMHSPVPPQGVLSTRLINYSGAVEQAVHDLIRWVEDGVEPLPSGVFDYAPPLLKLPAAAGDRGGIQPVVEARANGEARADVAVGEPVTLDAFATAPPGSGTIISAEWDPDGTGTWSAAHPVDGSKATVRFSVTHTYSEPGTYFPAARAEAHRDGDVTARHRRIPNLARVRVVVHPR